MAWDLPGTLESVSVPKMNQPETGAFFWVVLMVLVHHQSDLVFAGYFLVGGYGGPCMQYFIASGT